MIFFLQKHRSKIISAFTASIGNAQYAPQKLKF